ncbi:MAG: orotidine-5'-phosphate decarboxylase [Methanobacteriaceae archaeon]|jgi:orotidine-5'-phosphate decarboxylase|nr:MAG: orotidine-5'-phosphate decarboxylase [Methanobacterium sp. BRmetb2]MCC7557378.1 orotidine-5'-phosphate decarboxylase [Methanobacteriaceae archaeon]
MEVQNNIILAMDVRKLSKGLQIAESISDYINTVKVGYPLVLSEGLESISIIKDSFDFKVIADFKVADIPETNSKICDLTFESGADAVIVQGFVGEDSVKACLDRAVEHSKEVFLLTEMSHPGASRFLQKVSEDIAQMGVEMGITNYVAPSTKLHRLKEIRKIVGDSFIISPGVGVQGGTPKETLHYADALIIGRSIYESQNPRESTKSIIDSIKL